jgi:transposase
MPIDRNGFNRKSDVVDLQLTELQIQFCHKFTANGGNISKASEEMGLSRPTAYSYLKQQKVKDYLQTITTCDVKKDIATTEELLAILSQIARGEIKDSMFNFKTGEVVELLPNGMTRTNAIQLILRQRGELVNKIELETNVYAQLPPTVLDITPLAKKEKPMLLPVDVDYEVIDGE